MEDRSQNKQPALDTEAVSVRLNVDLQAATKIEVAVVQNQSVRSSQLMTGTRMLPASSSDSESSP
jgi:hypothetical protein